MILLVEDDPDIREVTTALLNMEDFSVRSAATAEDAWDMLLSQPLPKVIIVDYLLPGMWGDQLVKLIQAHERSRHVPIIFTSAHPFHPKLKSCHLLARPYSCETLLKAIRCCLKKDVVCDCSP